MEKNKKKKEGKKKSTEKKVILLYCNVTPKEGSFLIYHAAPTAVVQVSFVCG